MNGKTGRRNPIIISSALYLTQWLANHPFRDDPEAPLWVHYQYKKAPHQLRYDTIRNLLVRYFERAGIKKQVHPCLFRHLRATQLLSEGIMNEQSLKIYLGWTSDSSMIANYAHLVTRDANDAILRENNLTPIQQKAAQVCKRGASWVAQWWEDGHRRKRTLGAMSKAEAKEALAGIVAPINERQSAPSQVRTLTDFIDLIYRPMYRRKCKRSRAMTNKERISYRVDANLGFRALGSFRREELQSFLDRKAAQGLSYSVVTHLRWDLKQIFALAVSEGFIYRNPAELLFASRDCPRPAMRIMTIKEVRSLFSVLEVRERLIAKLAIVAGMRPGEIFALQWGRLETEYAHIHQRVYRGDVDSPKSPFSARWAALFDDLRSEVALWRSMTIYSRPEAWLFPSDRITTPLSRDNCWRRHFLPKLQSAGLEWINFQIMRETHSCLLKELDVDPQVRAEQIGHTVDVNQNVYTRTSLERRREAVNRLDSVLGEK